MAQHTDILQGLPKQLLILFGTIVDNNIVNNWSIYENSNKQTCVTIRFNDNNTAIQPAYYRRVSENQARRNLDRAANYNKNKHSDTTRTQASLTPHQMLKINMCTQTTGCNEDNEDSFNPKKRKVQASSPEMPRSDIKEEYQNDCFVSPDKVEYVTNISTSCTMDTYNIDTPIKIDEVKVEYQFKTHDDSFSSCTSDVLSDAKKHEDRDKYNSPIHEPQPEYLIKAQKELTQDILPLEVDLSTTSLLPSPDIVTTKSRAKLAKPQPIMCPCCDSIMSPTHNCEIDLLSDPNSDVPPTPPLLVPCPEKLMHPPDTADGNTDFKFNDPAFGEMFNTHLNSESGSESCKTQ